MLYWFLVIVALVNIVTYGADNDMYALWMYAFIAGIVFVFHLSRMLGLMMAILLSAMIHAMNTKEGMRSKEKEKAKKKPKSGMFELEGLATNTTQLVKRQQNLFDLASKMEPMMKQVTEMMKNMPEGFMETAMQNLKQKLKKQE
jgi:vacuolar-type H+-ATPase subunit C/Vma6